MTFRHKAVRAGLALSLAGLMTFAAVPPTVARADDPAQQLEEAAAQLDALGAELSASQAELAEATTNLENKDYEVTEKQAEVEQTRAELEERRADLASTLRTSYKGGSSSLIEFVLGSTSFEDLANRLYYADRISDQQTQVVNDVQALSEQLASEQQTLETEQADLQQQVSDLESQVASYQAQVSEAQELYDSLDAEVQAQLAAQREAEQNANLATALDTVTPSQDNSQPATGGQEQPDNGGASTPPADTGTTPSGGGSTNVPSGGGVATALAQVGKPYSWGATGPNAFDCSGLVCYCYGYARGRTTYAMIDSLKKSGDWKTSLDQLSYGDLVFPHSGHVGIYIGNGQMVHASSPGVGVIISDINSFYGGSILGGGPY